MTDEQGFIIPDAVVDAVGSQGNVLASDTTDDHGEFTLKGLPNDALNVHLRVSHPDFMMEPVALVDLVRSAGGREGVLLSLEHNDSCCSRMTVTITGDNTNTGLAGVEVWLRRGDRRITTARTNELGRVTFEHVCDGEYNLRASKDGYTVVERGGINIANCDTASVTLSMSRSTGGENRDSCCNSVLKVIPRDSATNAVITDAEVRVGRVGSDNRTVRTNGDGAIIRELCEGQYNVRIAREGYHVVEFSVTIGCNDTVISTRSMVRTENNSNNDSCCAGRATIIVRDSTTGAIITGGTVKLWKNGVLIGTREAGQSGATFEGLCQGRYEASVTRGDYRGQEFAFEIGCNGRVELTRRLLRQESNNDTCCNGTLNVIMRDSTTNAVIANATVKLWRGGTLVATRTTNANGLARFEGLCSGAYGLGLIREGYATREANVTLGCNQNLEMTRKLLRNSSQETCCSASLLLKVKDSAVSEGGWISGVTVVISKLNTPVATGTTNGDGRYLREELCGNATYSVTFSKTGFVSKTVTFTYTECRRIEETIRLVRQ